MVYLGFQRKSRLQPVLSGQLVSQYKGVHSESKVEKKRTMVCKLGCESEKDRHTDTQNDDVKLLHPSLTMGVMMGKVFI